MCHKEAEQKLMWAELSAGMDLASAYVLRSRLYAVSNFGSREKEPEEEAVTGGGNTREVGGRETVVDFQDREHSKEATA